MTNRKSLSAHEALCAHALIARLDKAIPLANAAKLSGDEAWLRYYRECLEALLETGGQHAQKYMSEIEPHLTRHERKAVEARSQHRG